MLNAAPLDGLITGLKHGISPLGCLTAMLRQIISSAVMLRPRRCFWGGLMTATGGGIFIIGFLLSDLGLSAEHRNPQAESLNSSKAKLKYRKPQMENPLSVYHWRKGQLLVSDDTNTENDSPARGNLHRSALSIIHLQRVYQIDFHSLERGLLYDVDNTYTENTTESMSNALNAEDFFIIGTVALVHELYDEAIVWLSAAEDTMTPNRNISPTHNHKASEEQNCNCNQTEISSAEGTKNIISNETEELPPKQLQKIYWSLCREDPKTGKKDLQCRHQQQTISYGFWKVEVLHYNPHVVLVHDVMSTPETTRLKAEAQTKFSSSQTTVEDDSSFEPESYRISQTAWIESENVLEQRLSRRTHDITGLHSMVKELDSDAEKLQVNLYEPGGAYEPHYDILGDTNVPPYIQNTGDRLATILFYLQDVKAGGATVFPFLNLRVPVIKGAAVFWYNLHNDGRPDKRTLHAGCPVIWGTKWVAVKWIHERNQIFSKPCISQNMSPYK